MNCVQCNKLTNNPKFCSRSCAAIFTNKATPKRKRTTVCHISGCDTITKSYRHTKCEHHWQEYLDTRISNKTLGEYRNLLSVKGKHVSWRNSHIRLHARAQHKALLKEPCAHCGYSKHVELCHIKPVSEFPDEALVGAVNSRENVIQLCPNCHWEFDNLPR